MFSAQILTTYSCLWVFSCVVARTSLCACPKIWTTHASEGWPWKKKKKKNVELTHCFKNGMIPVAPFGWVHFSTKQGCLEQLLTIWRNTSAKKSFLQTMVRSRNLAHHREGIRMDSWQLFDEVWSWCSYLSERWKFDSICQITVNLCEPTTFFAAREVTK